MAYGPELNAQGQRTVWLEDAMADRLGAMRRPGELYSDVILRKGRMNVSLAHSRSPSRRFVLRALAALPALPGFSMSPLRKPNPQRRSPRGTTERRSRRSSISSARPPTRRARPLFHPRNASRPSTRTARCGLSIRFIRN